MTSRLSILRSRLARLRRVRALLRLSSAACALITTTGLALLTVFFVDWLFRLQPLERGVVLVIAALIVSWAYWRLAHPLLKRRESELETALFVERQHDIDSDLIAALEFASPRRHPSGSPQLAAAVVDYVREASPQIDVFQGLSAGQFLRRFSGMIVVLTAIVSLVFAVPRHAAVFVDRLLLGAQPYPTRTQIEQVLVGDAVVFSAAKKDAQPMDVKAPEGMPVKFTLTATGVLPSSALIDVASTSGASSAMRVELKSEHTSVGGERTFIGQLPRLVEDATYRISAGDAELARARIRMIPLPIIELQLAVYPPAYAAHSHGPPDPASRTTSLLEGSAIQFHVESKNRKPLKSVSVTFQSASPSEPITLVPFDENRLRWTSPGGLAALANVRSELRYEVQATDDDGLSPQIPLRGVIRVRPDQLPTASLELVHRVVLPAARPVVTFRATDDHGIAAAELVVDVERGAENTVPAATADAATSFEAPDENPAAAPPAVETFRFLLPLDQQPLTGQRLPASGAYPLDLAPLKLSPGDRLKLAVEISDYRGQSADNPGGSKATSEARVLEIADESGVLAAIREADQRSESQLNDLIRRQLNIGEQP